MMEALFTDFLERLHVLNRDFVATFEGLPAEALDWVPGEDMNSFCVLVVHTAGATRFWIGDAALGESSNRNRDAEFRAKGLSADELKARLAAVEAYAEDALERLTLADLATWRVPNGGTSYQREFTVGWALLHALEHVGLHLGHAQITRQLWQQNLHF
jgi:uncharacterized damage-inducible protein DinB